MHGHRYATTWYPGIRCTSETKPFLPNDRVDLDHHQVHCDRHHCEYGRKPPVMIHRRGELSGDANQDLQVEP